MCNLNDPTKESKVEIDSISEQQTFNEIRNVKNSNSDIKEPLLELLIIESKKMLNEKIVITPNSINNKLHKLGEKFTFGKNLETNSFNFHEDEENIADNQFEITYEKGKRE